MGLLRLSLGIFFSVLLLESYAKETKMRLLIDTDAGIDDAQAILMALNAPDIEIVGITTVSGNTPARQVSLNVLRLLKVANRSDIPVYEGVSEGLLGIAKHASYYHGKDGFGDVPDPNAPDASGIQSEHGVSAILTLARRYQGELTLVALGPLSNIAAAIRLDPSLKEKFKEVYLMGGNHEGKGNTVPAAEFNFLADPEAAFATLNGLKMSTIVTWETCMKYSFSWKWFQRFLSVNTSKGKFMAKIYGTVVERYYKNQVEGSPQSRFIMADQIIMAALINPDIVTKTETVYSSVELGGKYCRGQMVVDWKGLFGIKPNTNIVINLKKIHLSRMAFQSLE